MKKLTLLLLACIALPSCHRTSGEMWQDTKTCGRHLGKGVSSLFGRQRSKEERAEFEAWNEEAAFHSLENTSYEEITLEDFETPESAAIPGIEGFATPHGALAHLFKNIQFDTDNYTIKGEDNIKCLREIAAYLTKNPSTTIYIEGHADERGAAAYNLALGSRRANSVRSYLVECGVNADQLLTISYGKERPIAEAHDANSWKCNRRSQFKVYDR